MIAERTILDEIRDSLAALHDRFDALESKLEDTKPAPTAELVDRRGIADHLRVSVDTIDRWAREGVIPSIKGGRRRMFDLASVLKTMSEREAIK